MVSPGTNRYTGAKQTGYGLGGTCACCCSCQVLAGYSLAIAEGEPGDSGMKQASVYLETKRLILRRLTEADADNLLKLESDPEVMRYLTGGVPHTRDKIVTEVLPYYLGYYERYQQYGFWAAIERATGEFIGWFHFRPYRAAPEEIELGYRLKRSAWGKGYATEGSRALIKKGFSEFGVGKIVADTLAANVRSRRVMEAIGMQLEQEFVCEPSEFPDWSEEERKGVKYALTKAHWKDGAIV